MNAEFLRTADDREHIPDPVYIMTFGGLRLKIGDSLVNESDWRGRCTKLLLKAIIVHGGAQVPAELLAHLLWAEADEARAIGNFKVTLLRLRKIISRLGISNPWIEMKNKKISLSDSICRVDSLEFIRCLSDALRDIHQIAPLIKALDLYSADFLINDTHVQWIENHRRHLQNEYIKGTLALFNRLAATGITDRPIPLLLRAVDMDPLNEELYVRLMQAYITQGYPSKAALIFNQARETLQNKLATGPGPNLLSLAKCICDPK